MKKTVKIILGVVGALAVIGGITAVVLMYSKTKENYELQLATQEGRIAALQNQLDEIGTITTTYQLKYDVKSGTIIEEEDLQPVDIPEKYAYDEDTRKTGYITNINDVVGQRYKTDIAAGTVLTPALVYPNDLTGDLRYLDVVFDELPIAISVGDYIDVRFEFALGQDFIAMTHKEIVAINANVLKLVVSQADIYVYESMKKDKSFYPATKLYAVQYVDGGVQQGADKYYPMRLEVLATMVQDPNIGDTFDMTDYQYVDRDLLEEQLFSNTDANTNELYGQLVDLLESTQNELKQQYQAGVQAYEAAQEGNGTSGSSGAATQSTGLESVYN
jgi:hypothetical protein